MGYTTEFRGMLDINPPLSPEQVAYIQAFNKTRRMKRDSFGASKLPDPLREAICYPMGVEGEFYVGTGEDYGQTSTPDIIDYNSPSSYQPGLWCQWTVSNDGKYLHWDGGEKFYEYTEWLNYLIKSFFEPWKRVLKGEISWEGEDSSDQGKLIVEGNVVRTSNFDGWGYSRPTMTRTY